VRRGQPASAVPYPVAGPVSAASGSGTAAPASPPRSRSWRPTASRSACGYGSSPCSASRPPAHSRICLRQSLTRSTSPPVLADGDCGGSVLALPYRRRRLGPEPPDRFSESVGRAPLRQRMSNTAFNTASRR